MYKFSWDEKQKFESRRKIWNLILTPVMGTVGNGNRQMCVARYTSTKELLNNHLETERNVNYSKAAAAIDVRLEWLCTELSRLQIYAEDLRLVKMGDWYRLSNSDCHPQIRHNGFKHTRKDSSRYSTVTTRTYEKTLSACPGTHRFFFHLEKEEKKLENILEMEEAKIAKHAVFDGNGYLQYAGADWIWSYALRHHASVIPKWANLRCCRISVRCSGWIERKVFLICCKEKWGEWKM